MAFPPPPPAIEPAPATHLFSITPNDGATFTTATRAIYIGAAGDLAVQAISDSAPMTLSNVPAGTVLQIAAMAVFATGTTASGIVGMW